MTGSAWLMLTVTWTVIIGFTSYFFVKVLRHGEPPSDEKPEADGPPGPDGP